jgi:hypothetical protein
MIGLRPRLRSHNSLLDLLERGRLDQLSPRTVASLNPEVDDLPPLPFSPPSVPTTPNASRTYFSPATPQIEELPEPPSPIRFPIQSPKTPPPRSSSPTPLRSPIKMAPSKSQRAREEAGEDQYGSIFSVSGPVVVAENMIGCAMYELVCSYELLPTTSNPSLG